MSDACDRIRTEGPAYPGMQNIVVKYTINFFVAHCFKVSWSQNLFLIMAS
jgi:hypothetical protein